jgi:hypothetical protein
MLFKFNKRYYLWAVLLLITEVLIALHLHYSFIRPFGGDVLVVILLYCMLKSVVVVKVNTAAVIVLLTAYTIEALQYFNIVYVLGWGNSSLARTIIGTTFTWSDILAYTTGIIMALLTERINRSFLQCSTS